MSSVGKKEFVFGLLREDPGISDNDAALAWEKDNPSDKLAVATVKKFRTEFEEWDAYDEAEGLQEFLSSQGTIVLEQFAHIEKLLGPAGSDWQWVGEHCEVLIRQFLRSFLPPSLALGKGYVHGVLEEGGVKTRCPEIDIIIYDQEKFAPFFIMGDFVIVHPKSVMAMLQVKRTLDATTLTKAMKNIVLARRHVLSATPYPRRNLYSAIVTFENDLAGRSGDRLTRSYETTITQYFDRDRVAELPDFIGGLRGEFLSLSDYNIHKIGYMAYKSKFENKNIALPMLLDRMMHKIRDFGLHLPRAYPAEVKGYEFLTLYDDGFLTS